MISAAALALAGLSLDACSKPPPAQVSTTRVFARDMEGKAAICTISDVQAADGKETPETMATSGGGWCGIPLRSAAGPYTAGLLTQPAHNGRVYVHTVGDDTRIDYIPKAGPVVPDVFAVQLIPGNAIVRVSVTPASTTGTKS
jgi:hypothetical protein